MVIGRLLSRIAPLSPLDFVGWDLPLQPIDLSF